MRKRKNESALDSFLRGTNSCAHEYLGAHREGENVVFRVWAPSARFAFVVGDFNLWDESCPMKNIGGGVFEAAVEADRLSNGARYKFKLRTENGDVYRSDPYARFYDGPPEMASRFYESAYEWSDGGWLDFRRASFASLYSRPMHIYELHAGAWRRHGDGRFYTYGELARELAPYAKRMGYTHVQLMPVTEHFLYESQGYGAVGYFAPTCRYGEPDELRYFVDYMHRSGIGVIFEWVPSHFAACEPGLSLFDGHPLYEYSEPERARARYADALRFDIGRAEVRSFLISSAVFFAKELHADGLMVDSVGSMIYLDRDPNDMCRAPNVYVGRRCREAVSFFRELNSAVKKSAPDVMMIAQESAAWSNVTKNDNGGLGFDLKWNMGFAGDTAAYAKKEPRLRAGDPEKLKFPWVYSFAEKYIVPLPGCSLEAGKGVFLDLMPGDYLQKFAGARLFFAYRMCFPGKKISFMGTEIGQFSAFSQDLPTEWFLLGYDMHAKLQKYVEDLNHFYLRRPELYEADSSCELSRRISFEKDDIGVTALSRADRGGDELFAVFNFTSEPKYAFDLGLSSGGIYREIFNSDRREYGGGGVENPGKIRAMEESGKYSIRITVPPLGCAIYEKELKI